MTSAELRRIVEAMTERPFCMCGVGRFVTAPCHKCVAKSTLANHADALVALVEAAEMFERTRHSDDDYAARRALIVALADVHAIKEQP